MTAQEPLRLTAVALGGRRANAIGVIRFELGPDALAMEFVQVAAFADGFAPGALADVVQIHASYTTLRSVVRRGDLVSISLDPARVTPFNRFLLGHFAQPDRQPKEALQRWLHARDRARHGGAAPALAVGALAAGFSPRAFEGAIWARLLLGSLVAGGAYLAARWLLEAWSPDDPVSRELGRRFEIELAKRVTSRAGAEEIEDTTVTRSGGLAPLGTMGGVLLASLSALGFVLALSFRRGEATPRATSDDARARRGIAAAARGVHITLPEPPPVARCGCLRADSPLWRDGVPRLAILTFHGEDELDAPLTPAVDADGHAGFDFDLAVVNNGADAVRDVRVTLTFARRDAEGKRADVTDRGLFWEGALAPGASVKWRVSAPGTEVRIDASVTGTLDEARVDAAPADAFFKLNASRFRALRAHGAKMLAYLRDPRAEVLLGSGSPRREEAELAARIRRASAPVIVCDRRAAPDGASDVCVFNGATTARRHLALHRVGDEGPATPIDQELPVHEGRRVIVGSSPSLDTPDELEIVAQTSTESE